MRVRRARRAMRAMRTMRAMTDVSGLDRAERADGAPTHRGGRGGVATECAAVLVAILAAAILAPVGLSLEVRAWRSGELLYRAPIASRERFEVSFTHSVERTPVVEVFEVGRDGGICLVETVYQSFGAGLPTEADEGARLILGGGKIRITGMKRRIGELIVAVSFVPGHALAVGTHRVLLAELASPGTALVVRAVRTPAVLSVLGGMGEWARRERS